MEKIGAIVEVGVIRYQSVRTNEGSAWQRDTEFVAPLSGVYYFHIDVFDSSRGVRQVSIRKNGEIVSQRNANSRKQTVTWNWKQNIVLFLQKGDKVDSFHNGNPAWSKLKKKYANIYPNIDNIFLGFRMGPS